MNRDEIERLLGHYRFADVALRQRGKGMLPSDRGVLEGERAEAFSRLLDIVSGEPAIAIAQLRVLVGSLAENGQDPEVSSTLAAMAERHLDELSRAVHGATRSPPAPSARRTVSLCTGWPSESELHALDNDPNRAAIIGTGYRYLYSNAANAVFHDALPTSLMGMPLWETTTPEYFARVSKPVFDRCFAGEPASFVSSHPGRDASQVYSIHLDPIRDKRGRVIAALGTVRLVNAISSSSSA